MAKSLPKKLKLKSKHHIFSARKLFSNIGRGDKTSRIQNFLSSALQDRKTPEGDEKNRKNRLETYSTIFLDSTGIDRTCQDRMVPPLRGAQPRISGSCFFAMIDWIPSEGGTHSEWVPPLREGHNKEFLGSAFLA